MKYAKDVRVPGLGMQPLEDRVVPAVTVFAANTLTVDFDAAAESVSFTNDGANITLTSSSAITGAGAVFPTAGVNKIVVTDSGSLPGQTATFAAGLSFGLPAGLNVSGIETAELKVDVVGPITGNAATVNVTAPGEFEDGYNLTAAGGNLNVAAGTYPVANGLNISKPITVTGAGMNATEIRKAGAPTSDFDQLFQISANNVTLAGAQLGWQTHTSATDYQGYVVVVYGSDATLSGLRFGDNYRSGVVMSNANGLEISDSEFTGIFGRGAIRDDLAKDVGTGLLITRNKFLEDHFRNGPITIEGSGTFSGEISYNYFASGVRAGAFDPTGAPLNTVTVNSPNLAAAGLKIVYNTFDWRDSAVLNSLGQTPQANGVYVNPLNAYAPGAILVEDNIFRGFQYVAPAVAPGVTVVPGKFGNAVQFDGVDDYARFRFPDLPAYAIGDQGSLSFWVNTTNTGVRNQFFSGPNNGNMEFQYRPNGGGQFYGRVNTANSNDYAIQNGGAAAVLAGGWTNMVYTWDFAAKTMRIYMNGVEVPYLAGFDQNITPSTWGNVVDTVNRDFFVGRDPSNNDRYFKGLMDDATWFNTIVTPAQIANLQISAGNALGDATGLIAHWAFDGVTGIQTFDTVASIPMNIYTAVGAEVASGPEWRPTAGKYAGALQFDGTDDYATFQSAAFDVGAQGSLSLWVNMDMGTLRNNLFGGPGNSGFQFQYRDDSLGQFYGYPNNNGVDYSGTGDAVVSAGGQGVGANISRWMHLGYTWDINAGGPTDGVMRIYLDGAELGYLVSNDQTVSPWTVIAGTINGEMNVGRDPAFTGNADPKQRRFYAGQMDDVAWFNRPLSSAEMAGIAAAPGALSTQALGVDAKLVAYWNFDQSSGATAVDAKNGIVMSLSSTAPSAGFQSHAVRGPASLLVNNNVFFDNQVNVNAGPTVTNAIVADPVFADTGVYDPTTTAPEKYFALKQLSPALFAATGFPTPNKINIGAYQGPPVGPFTFVYVDDAWTGLPFLTLIVDADPVSPGNQPIYTGLTGFDTMTDGLTNVTPTGAVLVNDGTYLEAVTVAAQVVTLIGLGPVTPGTVTFSSLAGAATAVVNLSSSSYGILDNKLVVGDAASTSFDGVLGGLVGKGSLVKQGAGTLTLTGANTYGGTTAVTAGTLLVNGTNSGTGAVAVQGGGTLGGYGTVGGDVTVGAGAVITGGTVGGAGMFVMKSISFNGGTYAADFSGDASDTLVTTGGPVNLNAGTAGVFTINSQSGTASAGNVFYLIANLHPTNPIVNPPFTGAAESATTTINGKTATYTYLGGFGGNDFTLTVVGPVVVGGTAGKDYVLYRVDQGGANDLLQLTEDGVIIDSRPLSGALAGFTLVADPAGGDDTLTVDYGASGGYFQTPVTFTATNGAANKITVTGSSFDTVVYDANSQTATSVITLTKAGFVGLYRASPTTISFTGVELGATVSSGIKAATINIDPGATNAGANSLTLTDAAGANLLADLSAVGGSFTDLTFSVPTAAFTVNADAANADTVTWTSVDGTYSAATTINGGAADTVSLNAPLVLGSGISVGSLFATAGKVALTAPVNTTAGGTTGTVTLTAGDLLTLAGNIQTDGANVVLLGTATGVAVGANVTVDTETGNDSAAGAVTFAGSAAITSTGGRFDLTVNTDTTGAAAGKITLVNVLDADGAGATYDFVNDLFVSALGAPNGFVALPTTIDLGGNVGDVSSATVRGTAYITVSSSIQTDDAVFDGGFIDLSAADVSSETFNKTLTLLTEATAAGKTGGAVTLGTFSQLVGAYILNLIVDTDTPTTAGGTVTFGAAAQIAGDLTVTAGTVNSNATFTAGFGAANFVSLTSDAGIVDGNGLGLNFSVPSGTVTASAVTGLEFDTTTAKLGATVSAGDATIRETDAVVLTGANVSGTYFLTTGGAVTQTGAVVATNFRLVSGGDATLTNPANNVGTLAAAVTGSLSYTDANGLTVGTLGATVGVTASNDVTLTTGGTLLISSPVTATTGAVTATASADLTVNAAVTAGAGVTLTGNNGVGSNILINAAVDGTFAKVFGNGGQDTVTVNTTGTTLLQLDLKGNNDVYTVNYGTLAAVVAIQDTGAGSTDKAFLNGTAAAETFEVNETGFPLLVRVGTQKVTYTTTLEQMTLDGGTSADVYNVQFANGPLPSGFLKIADTGAAGTDVANLKGTNAADLIDVNFTTAQRVFLGTENVDYTAGLETLNVFALDGNDTFRARPTPNALVTEINLFGGIPVVPVGDTLILSVVGVTAPVVSDPALPDGFVTSSSHKTVTWNSIETFPVPLGLGGSFDFNARNSAGFPETQPGWIPVIPTDTFAGGTYAGAAGWQSAALGFDRKDIGLGVTGQAAALLSDGAWGYDGVAGQSVFRVVTGPNIVRVTLTAGDTYFRRDYVAVYANGESTPRYVFHTNVAEFQQAIFDVDMTGDADGILELTIRDEGGYSYWTVNSLDVRPLGLVAALTLPTISAPTSTDLPADGLTVDTYSGSKAQPGTLLTVTPVGGTGRITTPDADPFVSGTQVLADGSGNFTIDFLRGTGTSDVTFTVQEVYSNSKVVVTQTGYDLPTVRKIDFGPAASGVQPGYLGFPASKYTSVSKDALGWAGSSLPGEFSSAGAMGDLLRDGAYNRRNLTGVYHFDLPAGDYWVTATFGDAGQPRVAENVFAVTGTAASPITGINTAAGEYYSGTFKASTTAGGVLELGVNSLGSYWSLNAVEIRPYTAPLTLGGPGSAPADGATPITITGTGARPNELVTATTDYGTVTSPDASPYYAGVQVLADGGGDFSFQFTPAFSTTSASAYLTATGVLGGVVANRTQPLTAAPPVPPAASSQRFDFNANSPGPTAAGFTAVRGSEIYSPSVGYGWATAQLEFERNAADVALLGVSPTQVPLYQDGAYGYGSNPGVFQVKVTPGTTGISARVYVGDSYMDWPFITVQAEGGSVVNSPGRFAALTLTGSDANSDGVFTVTVSNINLGSIWVVNGIDVAVGGSLPGLPLTAAPDFGKTPTGVMVSPADLAKTVDAAVARWAAAGATPDQLAALRATPVRLGDLDGTGHFGANLGSNIVIDPDAAGRGWFVDPTPLADEEFTRGRVPTQLLGGAAVAGVDLLTVVMHEFGHTLGRIDLDAATHPGELMTEAMGSGERRLPANASVVRLDGPSDISGVYVGDAVTQSAAVAPNGVFVGAETFTAPAATPKPAEQSKPAKKPAAAAFEDELLALWVG